MSESARSDGPHQEAAAPARQGAASKPQGKPAELDFGDPLSQQSADDTDRGWGERPAGGAADLARFLDEKPPHHL